MKAGKYIKGDRVIWMVILLLSVISLLAVYSSSQSLAFRSQNNSTLYFLIKQLIILTLGIFIVVLTHNIPYRYFSKLAQIFLIISIPLLLITLLSGKDIN